MSSKYAIIEGDGGTVFIAPGSGTGVIEGAGLGIGGDNGL